MPERASLIRDAVTRTYDLIVIGGGINGAGIAREAALRGCLVLLLDRHDYGFGTTWRSTKLIHGGLRYLQHHEWRLVREGLRERRTLLRIAPHLVRPLPFLVPVFQRGRYGRRTIAAGLTLYDRLAHGDELAGHRYMDARAVIHLEPALTGAAISGGFVYTDGQVELPERLCLDNILDAGRAGAFALNYVEVTGVVRSAGRVAGVTALDRLTGADYQIRSRLVVNAAGPWVDDVLRGAGLRAPRLGGTRGTHIVAQLPGGGPRRAIYAEAGSDGRPFFVIPWRGASLIGTTDDHHEGDPASIRPLARDVAYLLRESRRVLPATPIRTEDVWYAFAGIRPLPAASGRRAGAITRRHTVVEHDGEQLPGLITVIGGKLTSYRRLAEEVTDLAERRLASPHVLSQTSKRPLVPGNLPSVQSPLDRHLSAIYGPLMRRVLALAAVRPELRTTLCPHVWDIGAQVIYGVRHEGAQTVGDVLLRRTPAGWSRCRGLDAAEQVAALMATELGWSAEQQHRQVQQYGDEVRAALVTLPELGAGPPGSTGSASQAAAPNGVPLSRT